jgi:peroxiredoxin
MSQAEVAGGTFTLPHEFPSKGYLLRDFVLTSARGRSIQLSDYRGRLNVVLIFAGDGSGSTSTSLLSDVASQYAHIRNEDAEVLAVVWRTSEQARNKAELIQLPYPLLIDEAGHLHHEFGAIDAQGKASVAVYITDRFGEVFGSYRKPDGQNLPTTKEILDWLEFINSQCPECEPPEWPLEFDGLGAK